MKNKYQQLGHKSKNIDKEIVFYCDGKPITNENEKIGNLTEGAEMNFEILSVSISDNNSSNDDYKIQEKIINKVSLNCANHPENKELLICVDCGKAFCEKCNDKHEGHKKLYKKELINSGKELKQKSNEISNMLVECGFSDSRGSNNLFMEEKQKINSNIDLIQKMVDEIKKTSRNINNSFNKTFDDNYPYIVDYKEKIGKLNARSLHLQTMKNEQDFLDYYYAYNEIKRKEKKILDYISSLKRQIDSYKETIKEFNEGTNAIIEKIKEDYNILINLQFREDIEQLGKSSFYRKTIDKSIGSITTKHLRGGTNKMNLINLLVPKEKSRLIDNERISYINKKKTLRNSEMLKLNQENSNQTGDEPKPNLICGIEPNTKNIFVFDKNAKNVSKINIDLQGLRIDKFLNQLSTLNFNGRFYLSGGFHYAKAFFRLNHGTKTLKQLNDMPTGHNYHGMIGINDCIYCVSGFNNKNVEKYEISSNTWTSLVPLELSFSWPGLLFIENKFLYVFGGLCEMASAPNKRIYKMDINSQDKWVGIDINSNLPKIPFYSGFVQLSDKNILVLGGKNSSIENNLDKCFMYDFGSNNYTENNEYKLPNREVFNGKKFCDLGGGMFGEFSCFSSYNKFYLVNTSSKTIDVFE